MPEHMTDAHFSFTFVFKQALRSIHPKAGGKLYAVAVEGEPQSDGHILRDGNAFLFSLF